MSFFKRIFCLFWFSALLLPLDGQNGLERVGVKIYEFEDGLSHRDVYQVGQDQQGFLWVATANGLNRFDSKNFLHFDKDSLLTTQYITEIAFGSGSDGLWLSLPNRLLRFDTEQLAATGVDLSSDNPVAIQNGTSGRLQGDCSFNGLLMDVDNQLWTCIYDSGSGRSHLQCTNEEGVLEQVLPCEGRFENRAVAKWNDHLMVAFDENSLVGIDQSGSIAERYPISDPDDPNARLWITQLQNQGDTLLWALSNSGHVFFLKKGNDQFQQHDFSNAIRHRSVYNDLWVRPNGDIWVAGRNGLWWYQAADQRAKDFTPTIRDRVKHSVNFRQLFEDQTGVLWVASDFGLIKLTFSNPLFTTYLAQGNQHCYEGTCSTRGITEDDKGNIYFSYYNSIHRLDVANKVLTPLFPNIRFHNPPFGLKYHLGALWTGNGRRIDLASQTVDTLLEMPSTDLGYVMVDHEDELWVGFRNKLFTYDAKAKRLRYHQQLSASLDTTTLDISYLYQSPSDLTIWVGTLNSGLFRIDKYKGLLAHYDTEGANGVRFLHNKINCIYEDSRQQLWVATGNGLHQLDVSNQHLSVYLPEHGLSHSFINGVLSEGDSVLWVSTDNGLSRFSLSTNTCHNFKKEDGLSANEFNRVSCYKARNGRMYFGGIHGVNAFYPGDHFLKRTHHDEGQVILTQFSVLDGEKDSLITYNSGLQNGKPIRISWQDQLFTFRFALANFNHPGAHQFSYKLEGLDKKWSEASPLNEARYNSIPHGEYHFRVRARMGNANWNKTELTVPVEVDQAFYTTWWFGALCGVLLTGLVLLVSQYRLYQARKRELELKREVRARTLDLEREVKKSDELLLNILPANIAQELKTQGKAKARRHDIVTVFFSDFKGFTLIAQQLEPEELVAEIDYCFREFDKIMDKHHLEKIKTIGDAYMCAGGISDIDGDSAVRVVQAALDIQAFMKELADRKSKLGEPFFETRIGIHTGPVVSGIVGIKKFAFDIWGDTVNVAARLEDSSEVGKVNISQSTYELVKDHFNCRHRGKVSIKHQADIDMYYVDEGRDG